MIKLSFSSHNQPIPKVWYRVLLTIHGLCVTSGIASAVNGHLGLTIGIMAVGYISDMVIRFIREDNPEIDAPNKQPNQQA